MDYHLKSFTQAHVLLYVNHLGLIVFET